AENIRKLFDDVRQRAEENPNQKFVVIINEFDAIAAKRERTGKHDADNVNQLLTVLEKLPENVLFIGTTNLKQNLDTALWLRFGLDFRVPAPDENGRHEILKVHTAELPLDPKVDLASLAKRAMGFTGADIKTLTETASEAALARLVARGDGPLTVAKPAPS